MKNSRSKAILLVGCPLAGKTTYAGKIASPAYVHINTERSTEAEWSAELTKALRHGLNIILDGCHHTTASRRRILQYFEPFDYNISCHWLQTTYAASRLHADAVLSSDRGPYGVSLVVYHKELVPPSINEGYTTVKSIPYVYSAMENYKNKALFFDLDGTVRISSGKYDWPQYPTDISIFTDVHAALQNYQDDGYLLIGVTNQSGIARKRATEIQVQDCIIETIKGLKALITNVFYCPHLPDTGCACRKPNPGMAYRARELYQVNLGASVMVGNAKSDEQFAINAGIGRYYYREDFFPCAGRVSS